MNEMQQKEVNDALRVIDEILPMLGEAERKFSSARNWGFFDILGGGFITDLIKHSKLDGAARLMNQINYKLGELQRELKDVQFGTDYSMNTMTFATFADFVFDGAIADIYMQSKIMSSLSQVRDLQNRLINLRSYLINLMRR